MLELQLISCIQYIFYEWFSEWKYIGLSGVDFSRSGEREVVPPFSWFVKLGWSGWGLTRWGRGRMDRVLLTGEST